MDIQNLIFMVIMPIVHVADILRRNNSQTQEIKSLLYTTLTLLGQIQYHLSIQRRYMNRPLLKKIYSRLYSDDVPHLSRKLGWGHIFSKDTQKQHYIFKVHKDIYSKFSLCSNRNCDSVCTPAV